MTLLTKGAGKQYAVKYDPDAQLYFDESTDPLPSTFKRAVNWGILDLKSTGNWSKLNFLFIGYTPNQTLSRTNVKNPSHKLTEMISSGWSANEWWSGNGSRYLKLNWTPSIDGGSTYTQNNAGFTIMPAVHGQLNENVIPFGARQPSNYSDNYVSFSANNQYVAINGDQGTASGPKSAGVITLTRDNSANFKAWRQGVLKNTMAVISKALAAIEWVGLAWNNNGTIGAFTTYNKLMLMAAHSGDIDVAALNNTIKGIIVRLNGGYQMTTQTESISGMPAMDSCTLGTLTASKIGLFGGYSPGEPSNTTNKWFTSTDNGASWTAETVMSFRVAHALGGLRNDGFYWLFGYDPIQTKLFIMKLNTTTHAWTTVNGDLGAGDLSGLSYMQWGYFYNDEIYAAMSPDGGATVKLYKTSNGNNWSLVSTLPVAYAVNSSAYVDGTTIRFTGGCRYADPVMDNFVSNVYESTDGGVNWSIVRSLPANLQSAWPSFFKYNGHEFYLTGRNLATTIDEGFIYRWNGSQWINTLLIELSGRHAVAHLLHNNEMFFANGYLYNDCYKLSKI